VKRSACIAVLGALAISALLLGQAMPSTAPSGEGKVLGDVSGPLLDWSYP